MDSSTGDDTGRSAGLLASLQRLLETALGILQTRIEIVATEYEEERERIRELIVYGMLALFFLSIGVLLLMLFIVVLYWENYRLYVLGGFSLFYLALGFVITVMLRRRLKSRPRFLSTTLSELSRDRDGLRVQP